MSTLQKEFYSKLKNDKIAMNWNKSPIKMELFLSFLTIEPNRSHKHSGSDMGWTELTSEKLIIRGGIVSGTEYLDSLQYGVKLQNQYNNYVNPFYLFDIMNLEGKVFFANYYKKEILELLNSKKDKVKGLSEKLKEEKLVISEINQEFKILFLHDNN